jgi:hypothetical protein
VTWLDPVEQRWAALSAADFISVAAPVLLAGLGIWVTPPPRDKRWWITVCLFVLFAAFGVGASLWLVGDAKIEAARDKIQAAADRKNGREAADRRDARLSAQLQEITEAFRALPGQSEQINRLHAVARSLAAQLEWKFTPRQTDELSAGLTSMDATGTIAIGSLPKTESSQRAREIIAIFSARGWDAVGSGDGGDPATEGVVCTVPASSRAGIAAGKLLSKFPGFKIVSVPKGGVFPQGVDIDCSVYNRPK